ncbi:hypothetical protein TNCV_1096771 [Trichonephila clavipes]|nr:hypothetical protein TNCV_1096771 [Trichonephila clavipes]
MILEPAEKDTTKVFEHSFSPTNKGNEGCGVRFIYESTPYAYEKKISLVEAVSRHQTADERGSVNVMGF